jgi:hypothetical protein
MASIDTSLKTSIDGRHREKDGSRKDRLVLSRGPSWSCRVPGGMASEDRGLCLWRARRASERVRGVSHYRHITNTSSAASMRRSLGRVVPRRHLRSPVGPLSSQVVAGRAGQHGRRAQRVGCTADGPVGPGPPSRWRTWRAAPLGRGVGPPGGCAGGGLRGWGLSPPLLLSSISWLKTAPIYGAKNNTPSPGALGCSGGRGRPAAAGRQRGEGRRLQGQSGPAVGC